MEGPGTPSELELEQLLASISLDDDISSLSVDELLSRATALIEFGVDEASDHALDCIMRARELDESNTAVASMFASHAIRKCMGRVATSETLPQEVFTAFEQAIQTTEKTNGALIGDYAVFLFMIAGTSLALQMRLKGQFSYQIRIQTYFTIMQIISIRAPEIKTQPKQCMSTFYRWHQIICLLLTIMLHY